MSYYKNLHIWIKAMELVNFIYEVTKSFPKDEIFGLTNQIKRAAVSVPSNIAEGAGRNSNQ
jgi:four helix bundle protein